jgi:pimeloyl-ACP methyl ester carboxylesterase
MTMADDTQDFEHRVVETNAIKLHVVGGGSGPLVVMLHGWPECWATWRHVMGPIKKAGFTVAVPDMRGFNDSDKPAKVADYRTEHVAADIVGLVRSLGFERAHVVGHDWGGVVAWHIGQHMSDVLDKLVVINAPLMPLFAKRLFTLDQLRRSYYMFLFQLPVIPERLVSADGFRPVRNLLKHQPRKRDAFDDDDRRVYVEAIAKPGALTGGLNYYRAAFRAVVSGDKPSTAHVTRPTLVLWGLDDVSLPPTNLDGIDRFVDDLRVVRIPNCSHWVQHDAPDVIVQEALAHFTSSCA